MRRNDKCIFFSEDPQDIQGFYKRTDLPSIPVTSLDLLELAVGVECGIYCPPTGAA